MIVWVLTGCATHQLAAPMALSQSANLIGQQIRWEPDDVFIDFGDGTATPVVYVNGEPLPEPSVTLTIVIRCCPDLDGDGDVDGADWVLIAEAYPSIVLGDLTGDGRVTTADYSVVKANLTKRAEPYDPNCPHSGMWCE